MSEWEKTALAEIDQHSREREVKLEKILRSIVTDVEAMKAEAPHEIKQMGLSEEEKHWFGGFSSIAGSPDEELAFQWPNLGILIEEAKQILEGK